VHPAHHLNQHKLLKRIMDLPPMGEQRGMRRVTRAASLAATGRKAGSATKSASLARAGSSPP
jgi:hypothetical protein